MWRDEKAELLRTHPGWYVAYLNGERVALEPTLGQMEDALDRKLGSPHPSCEFHRVVAAPPRWGGLVPAPLLEGAPTEAREDPRETGGRDGQHEAGSPWQEEKPELLRTHPGWYVAYLDGERVALEPTLGDLGIALDRRLGSPRRPCEYHEIVARPKRWPGINPIPLLPDPSP